MWANSLPASEMEINMMKPKIFRRRYIPFETVDISGDELVFRDSEILVTRWKAIKPRGDFDGGISCTFLGKGYKISRFYGHTGEFLYWYVDIVDIEYDKDKDTYIMKDLLVDVKLMTDGELRVLDVDELAEALEKGIITTEQACLALRKLNEILKMIHDKQFPPGVCEEFE